MFYYLLLCRTLSRLKRVLSMCVFWLCLTKLISLLFLHNLVKHVLLYFEIKFINRL